MPPRLKLFEPLSWYDHTRGCERYVDHIFSELGRLGMEKHAIEDYGRAPHTQAVLSDLMDWLCERPESFARLHDWRWLNFEVLGKRLERDREAKPRIELTAHITKMNNLSVRWYPGGWRGTQFNWERESVSRFNLITQRLWSAPPDFSYFTGDEDPTFDSRPSNELMYIRGVGNLNPNPREEYGPYAEYNRDVVAALLICATRAAYEQLARELAQSFQVDVVDCFEFQTREEASLRNGGLSRSVTRVMDWSLEDVGELNERRARELAEASAKQEAEDFENFATRFGVELSIVASALAEATAKRTKDGSRLKEPVDRTASKVLVRGGHNINAATTKRARELMEKFSPELLPPDLLPSELTQVSYAQTSNIVRFPTGSDKT